MELHNNASFQWANDTSPISVTSEYIVPRAQRPNDALESISIPIIDMNNDEEIVVHEIAKACKEFGVFMIINHGILEELCNNVLDVITQFFNLPQDIKAQYFSHRHMDDGKIARYYLSENYQQSKKVALWSEAFYHTWHPVCTSSIQNLPENPSNYRDEQWFAVDPIAASLVVNVADQVQVLSNEKYKSILHRAVTNVKGRVSFATFCGLNKRSIIGPIQELVEHPSNHYYTRAKLDQTVVKQCFTITTFPTILSRPKSNAYFITKKNFTKLPSMHILPKVYI